ncbi:hypothetical protein M885DRAFT_439616 [Pelagophyceae sp. CCMP2097]|nr:hypothetical protein M885DRAFT_439616 [Pelagophyceae sp. CCMP2097]
MRDFKHHPSPRSPKIPQNTPNTFKPAGTFWCPFCDDQRQLFGKDAWRAIPRVEKRGKDRGQDSFFAAVFGPTPARGNGLCASSDPVLLGRGRRGVRFARRGFRRRGHFSVSG